jgi:hypothetical protein
VQSLATLIQVCLMGRFAWHVYPFGQTCYVRCNVTVNLFGYTVLHVLGAVVERGPMSSIGIHVAVLSLHVKLLS